MTDKQEKLLKIFKAQVEKEEKEYFCVNVYTQLLYDSHKTALNMLKEKDKEIEKLKKALARNVAKNFTTSMKETAKSKEDLEMLNKGWQIELEKKNKRLNRQSKLLIKKDKEINKQEKIIDLMAEQLAGLPVWNIKEDEPLILGDKEEVIEYFRKECEEC